MPLESRDKELVAIGASIGSNCEPCITYHLAAGREAGLSPAELDAAVASAHTVRREAVELLEARIDELLGRSGGGTRPAAIAQRSKAHELVALGVSVGANSHPLLRAHVGSALDVGLEVHEVKSALKMAGYVQQHAAALTAETVTRALAERVGTSAGPVAAN
jgi:4-carboxymuconolactone decarboxylase